MFALRQLGAIVAILLLAAPVGGFVDLTQYGAWFLYAGLAGLLVFAAVLVQALLEPWSWTSPDLEKWREDHDG